MNTKAIAAILTFVLISGCATTTPNPVPLAQSGDEGKSCAALAHEIADAQGRVAAAEQAGSVQTRKNVIYGVTGAFILVPWFFMDLGNAASVEATAARARLDRLNLIYGEKKCTVPA